MTTATYTPPITVELQYGGGFLAWSPDVPGLTAEGDTEAEARAKLRRALAALMEGAK